MIITDVADLKMFTKDQLVKIVADMQYSCAETALMRNNVIKEYNLLSVDELYAKARFPYVYTRPVQRTINEVRREEVLVSKQKYVKSIDAPMEHRPVYRYPVDKQHDAITTITGKQYVRDCVDLGTGIGVVLYTPTDDYKKRIKRLLKKIGYTGEVTFNG